MADDTVDNDIQTDKKDAEHLLHISEEPLSNSQHSRFSNEELVEEANTFGEIIEEEKNDIIIENADKMKEETKIVELAPIMRQENRQEQKQPEEDIDADVVDLVKNIKIRDENVKKFRRDFPQYKSLTQN